MVVGVCDIRNDNAIASIPSRRHGRADEGSDFGSVPADKLEIFEIAGAYNKANASAKAENQTVCREAVRVEFDPKENRRVPT